MSGRHTGRVAVVTGGSAFGIRCDISDGARVRDFVREVTQCCASPQILVHSAAIQFNRPFEEVTFAEWRRTQAVNQDSMFHFLQATLPAMKTAGWGRIVVIASSTFYINTSGLTHYVTQAK